MSIPTPEERATGRSGWLGLGLVTAVVGAWFMFLAVSPTEPPPPDSSLRRTDSFVREIDGSRVPSPLPRDDTAQLNLSNGTATESPYAVMVALAELEAFGDTLARVRGILPDSADLSIPMAPR